jgi:hypothetical protein
LPADLHYLATAELMVERATSDAIARLEHDHRVTGVDQVTGRAQAGQTRTDHDDSGASSRRWRRGGLAVGE